MNFITAFAGAGISIVIIQLWFRSDPEKPFLNFYLQKLKYWRKQQKRYRETSQLPQKKLAELEHGTRILVIDFTKQGDPVCKKILIDKQYDEFVLTHYMCTEKFKMPGRVYQVQHQEICVHLEYVYKRFESEYNWRDPDASPYYNHVNIPIIKSIP
jgi:hypothetical protein